MRLVYTFWFAMLLASAAYAAPPDARSDSGIAAVVQRELVAPYTEWRAEHGEFAREDMPPSEMRVRVLGDPHQDAQGAEFVAFAVDARVADGEWVPARITGCVYAESNAVYVKRGRAFLAAADYFAESAVPARSVCKSGSS